MVTHQSPQVGQRRHGGLPRVQRLLAVCAHPDDESFGLGAVLAAFTAAGTRTAVLCFTQGEASTLGKAADLGALRAGELTAAADVLGVARVDLLSYPDGGLTAVSLDNLTEHVRHAAMVNEAEMLLVFDEGGITGHPDHCRATEAACSAARRDGYPVLAWAIPRAMAEQLNAEYNTHFIGRADANLDVMITVDRARQRAAIACHQSQSASNPVLWRRLALLDDREWLRILL
jgi:LmbE family N-acetylglucosaminyl deacetylase